MRQWHTCMCTYTITYTKPSTQIYTQSYVRIISKYRRSHTRRERVKGEEGGMKGPEKDRRISNVAGKYLVHMILRRPIYSIIYSVNLTSSLFLLIEHTICGWVIY